MQVYEWYTRIARVTVLRVVYLPGIALTVTDMDVAPLVCSYTAHDHSVNVRQRLRMLALRHKQCVDDEGEDGEE